MKQQETLRFSRKGAVTIRWFSVGVAPLTDGELLDIVEKVVGRLPGARPVRA